MSCCADPRAEIWDRSPTATPFAMTPRPAGGAEVTLGITGMHCAGCIGTVERAVAALGSGLSARVNFTRQTVTLTAPDGDADPTEAVRALRNLGYVVRPLSAEPKVDEEGRALLRAIAVAGFGAMNVMLLSVAVWAGAEGETARVLNWFAALIALPALTYSARPFVASALAAVSARHINMDVPIALAIVLAAGMSLVKTIAGEGETYFDAAVTLTFFLLTGRYVAHYTRERSRSALSRLAHMQAPTARLADGDAVEAIPVGDVVPGMALALAAGERVPVDSRLNDASARFDASLVTGESEPVTLRAGDEVGAGLLALDGPLTVTALRPSRDSLLSRLMDLQKAAEATRPPLSRIADRAAAVYAPVVHLTALATFLGWLAAGATAGDALTIAIAVLIITCPCALGLAVPIVQAAATDALFRRGLVIKDGAVLERLRGVTSVVFDKTGTLTAPVLDTARPIADADLALATALARHSTHPVSAAIARAGAEAGLSIPSPAEVEEHHGRGVSGVLDGRPVYLGRGAPPFAPASKAPVGLNLWRASEPPVTVPMVELIRPDAAALIATLTADGLPVTILSGDRHEAVAAAARDLGVIDWHAGVSPGDKMATLAERTAAGDRPLMVGDGLNDGPALSLAHASIAVADASDLANASADLVMTTTRLGDVGAALDLARKSHRLTLQNLVLAAVYNAIAIPIAIAGFATPLAAAIGMSASSIVVIVNAQRIRSARL